MPRNLNLRRGYGGSFLSASREASCQLLEFHSVWWRTVSAVALVVACTACAALHVDPGTCASGITSRGQRSSLPARVERMDSLPGVVMGMVRDATTGEALGGATVDLRPGGYRTTSDSAGTFRFDVVGVGSKAVSARRYDYTSQSVYVRPEMGAGVDIDFQLVSARCDLDQSPLDVKVRKPGLIPRGAPPRIP